MLLRESGDIRTNQGPETSPLLNLNGLASHDFVNMPLIEAFITAQSFDIYVI